MALTATATSALRKQVESALGMNNPVYVIQSPDKTNIVYINFGGNFDKLLEHILTELTAKRTSLPRIIIFCKFKTDCPKIYTRKNGPKLY